MNFLVITAASAPSKLMGKYMAHMEAMNIPYRVYLNQNGHNDGKLGNCVRNWKEYAQEHIGVDRLILTDAWDVLAVNDRKWIEERLAELPADVVFASERNCWPEPALAQMIQAQSPWKFANGGMLTASPKSLIRWCDSVVKHQEYAPNEYTQQWLNRRLADGTFPVYLDRGTRLFYCMILENGELKMKDGRLWNSVLDSHPSFVHFNGNWPWGDVLRMLEKPEEA